MPASLRPIFVLHRPTDCCLAATAGNKAGEKRYANLLLAPLVYISEEGVVCVSKQ